MEDIHKAILQIIISAGIVEDGTLNGYIRTLQTDFPGQGIGVSLGDKFKLINSQLRPLSLEIRTVILKDENTNERVYYHGVANMSEDMISNKNSTSYNNEEISFFRELIIQLVEKNYLSTSDISKQKFNESEKDSLLERLQTDFWLQRNEINFWEIGPRTYLELRNFLEKVIKANQGIDTEKEDNTQENEEEVRILINKLPQTLFY